jgi:hypothetical protein
LAFHAAPGFFTRIVTLAANAPATQAGVLTRKALGGTLLGNAAANGEGIVVAHERS